MYQINELPVFPSNTESFLLAETKQTNIFSGKRPPISENSFLRAVFSTLFNEVNFA